MPKVNFSLEREVREELVRLVPARRRSQVVNEILREALLRIRRVHARRRLTELRDRTAKLSSEEIVAAVRADRRR